MYTSKYCCHMHICISISDNPGKIILNILQLVQVQPQKASEESVTTVNAATKLFNAITAISREWNCLTLMTKANDSFFFGSG